MIYMKNTNIETLEINKSFYYFKDMAVSISINKFEAYSYGTIFCPDLNIAKTYAKRKNFKNYYIIEPNQLFLILDEEKHNVNNFVFKILYKNKIGYKIFDIYHNSHCFEKHIK